jgi:hypothetical protein
MQSKTFIEYLEFIVMKTIVLSVLMFATILSFFYHSAASAQTPSGTVANSKFLNVTEQRFREGMYGDQITGEITNISTQNVSDIKAFATLYDKDNQIITTEFGAADVFTLPAGDYSAFNIGLTGLKNKQAIDHYVVTPGGIP